MPCPDTIQGFWAQKKRKAICDLILFRPNLANTQKITHRENTNTFSYVGRIYVYTMHVITFLPQGEKKALC